jgi:hypothetical protein
VENVAPSILKNLTLKNVVKMIVSEENCKNCPIFQDSNNKENMIKHNTCQKQEMVGCPFDN